MNGRTKFTKYSVECFLIFDCAVPLPVSYLILEKRYNQRSPLNHRNWNGHLMHWRYIQEGCRPKGILPAYGWVRVVRNTHDLQYMVLLISQVRHPSGLPLNLFWSFQYFFEQPSLPNLSTIPCSEIHYPTNDASARRKSCLVERQQSSERWKLKYDYCVWFLYCDIKIIQEIDKEIFVIPIVVFPP